MAKKQLIRLTEGDLHRIIKESIKRILKEEYNPFHEEYSGKHSEDSENDFDLDGYYDFLNKHGLNHISYPYNGVIVICKEDQGCNFMDENGNILSPVWFDDIDTDLWAENGQIYCELDEESYDFDSLQELIEYFQQ